MDDILEHPDTAQTSNDDDSQFRRVVEKSPVPMVITDTDGNIEHFNEKFIELFGWTIDDVQTPDEWWHAAYPDTEYRQQVQDSWEQAVERAIANGEEIQPQQWKLTCKNGEIRDVEFKMVSVSTTRSVITMTDITEQLRAEIQLKDSEQRYRMLAEHANDMISRHDIIGHYLYASPACKTLLGYEEHELLGHSAYEFFHPDDLAAIQKSHQTIIELPDVYTITYRIRRKDSTYIWFESVSKTVRDHVSGDPREIIVVSRDITERKKAEDALAESEHLYRTLFETMEQGVVYQDTEGRIISGNPAAERILGLTQDKLRGRTSFNKRWKAINEDGSEFPGDQHPSMLALRTGKPVRNTIMGIYNPITEETHWLLISAIPEFKVGEQSPYQVYTTFTDITERKAVEDTLRDRETRVGAILDTVDDGIITINVDGIIETFNAAAQKIFGYPENEVSGKPVTILMPEPHADQHKDYIRHYIQTGEAKIIGIGRELEAKHKDGSIFPMELLVSEMWIAGARKFTGVVRNIADRKRAQKSLQKSETNLKQSQAIAHLGSWEWIIDSGVSNWSDEQYRMFGYEPGEITPSFEFFIDTLVEEDKDKVVTAVNEALAGDAGYNIEFRLIRKDGQKRIINSQGVVERDAEDTPIRMFGTTLDITERKLAELALLESETQFRLIVEKSPMPMVIVDLEGNIELFNEKFVETFGWTTEDIYTPEQWWQAAYPDPVYRKAVQNIWETAVSEAIATGKEIKPQQWRLTCKSGDVREVEFRMVKVGPDRSIIVLDDITERKQHEQEIKRLNEVLEQRVKERTQALQNTNNELQKEIVERTNIEKALRLTESRLTEAQRIAHVGSWEWDVKNGLLTWSDEVYRIFGVDKKEFSPSVEKFMQFIPPDDRAPVDQAVQTALDKGVEYSIEHQIIRPSGEIRMVHERAEAIRDPTTNEPIWLVGTVQDITARKQVEEALRKSEEQFADLYDNAPDMHYSVDASNAKIITCNETATRRLGYKKEELTGMRVFQLVSEASQQTAKQAFEEFKRTGELHDIELEVLHKDGSIIPVSLNVTAVRDAKGNIIHSRSSLRDISQRKQTETELRNAMKELQNTQSQLIQAEKMASLGILTAGIAHEINNPINFIGSGTSALRKVLSQIFKIVDKYDSLPPEKFERNWHELQKLKKGLGYAELVTAVEELLTNIETGVQRTSEIVKGLRIFARQDTAELELCDIHASIDTTLMLLRSQYTDIANVQKNYGDIPKLKCYLGALNQVFMNILSNAIDAIKAKAAVSDKDEISIKTFIKELDNKKYVHIEIGDTGIGISKDTLLHLFDPFYTTKEVGKGTGLGLSISLGIVERHGGKISAYNKLQGGAVFEIVLPTNSFS